MTTNFSDKIFSISTNLEFETLALEIFRFQARHNPVYNQYIKFLNRKIDSVTKLSEISFLPIDFFKTQKVVIDFPEKIDFSPQIFTSSGTTGMEVSQHFVQNIALYESSFTKAFVQFYGEIENYCVLALLPSYLEREGSSLIYMVDELIKKSKHKDSGFYLHNLDELARKLENLVERKQKVLLIGVSFALLDLAEQFQLNLHNTIVMETGGMKGRRKELIRNELHEFLTRKLGVSTIHSEYGMTELLSQAYSLGFGRFSCPNWMRILIRDTYDPFCFLGSEKTGGINVIDLANLYSCSFIETKDLGRLHNDSSFEVLGRFDNSDIRGCNLMINND